MRLTGFSPAVLRTWERRYRILSPERGPGKQRLYTEDDLRLLRIIREHLAQGRTIGEIALDGRAALLHQDRRAPSPDRAEPPTDGHLDRCRKDLIDAAIDLDFPGMNRSLDDAFAVLPPDAVIAGVIEPAARDLGDLWEKGKCSVAAEHLATTCFLFRVSRLLETSGNDRHASNTAIVACLPGERHSLGARLLCYYLGRSGYQVSYFGSSLPLDALETACRKLQPRMVCLSATQPRLLARSRRQLLEFLRRWRGRTHALLGGLAVPTLDDELTGAGAVLWPAGRSASELLRAPVLHSADAWPKLKE